MKSDPDLHLDILHTLPESFYALAIPSPIATLRACETADFCTALGTVLPEITIVFKLSTQIFMLFVALMLSACANIASRDQYIATPAVQVPEFPVAAVLELPPLEVKELPIPIIPLNERAAVVMSESEIQCMALNMFHEARGEGDAGMIAVGYVVLNRMGSKRFDTKTVCATVHKSGIVKKTGKRACQFSWVCAGRTVASGSGSQASYQRALTLAREVMLRSVPNPVDDSVYFHNKTVRPTYTRAAYRGIIGTHRFYAAI